MNVAFQDLGGETGLDRILSFTIPARNARGRVLRLGPVLDAVLAAHDYPPQIRDLLSEALVLAALIGALLKHAGDQMTMQAQTEGGAVDLLVCDYRAGELRGYVRHDAERLAALGEAPSLEALFGSGYLAITFDIGATGQRYQGIVPLTGASLAAAAEHYFAQSEQVPTLIRVGIETGADGTIAGGLLVQHLPEGEDGRARLHVDLQHPDWEHVAALAGSTRGDELSDPALPLETLVWRLFHEEEVRVAKGTGLSRGCRCSVAHYQTVLARFAEAELAAMRDEDGLIRVDCAFCSKLFPIAM
ncbi:MAG: Hsp33 family molecular chaperone HslO [Sphingomonadales bacterium]|nr:Hsp33 family molecular chaperone HslO [Sphingomonadales bacterium]